LEKIKLEELIDELAKVFSDPGMAHVVLRRAGFRSADIPKLEGPLVFWDRVIEDVCNGKLDGGVRAVVEQATKLHPSNPVFCDYLSEVSTEVVDASLSILGDTEASRTDAPREYLDPFPGRMAWRGEHREPPELVAIGRRTADRVHWSYQTVRHIEPFFTREVAWDAALEGADQALQNEDGATLLALGLRLGRLLLGKVGEPGYHEVMRMLFDSRDSDEQTTPLAGAARCRLVLDDSLEALPWRLTAIQDVDGNPHWLTDQGWTFEHGAAEHSSKKVSLPNPCRIMFVVPQHGKLRDAGAKLVERATGQLGVMWPSERGGLGTLVAVAHGRAEVARVMSRIHPHWVVFFGRALAEPEPSLELWSDDGVSEPVALTGFVEELVAAKVEALVLATTSPVTLPATARGRLPCVLVPMLPASPVEAVETVSCWLDAMLAEGIDPVRALHRPPVSGPSRRWCAMQAHTAFRSWAIPPARAASDDKPARRRLDRDELRAVFTRHVDALIKDERRVVEAFVTHGRPEDRVEWLGEQLWEEYKDREPIWKASRKKVAFPREAGRTTLDDRFERVLIETLELEDGESPSHALEIEARRHGWPNRPFVYWLDWGAQLGGIKVAPLKAWIQLAIRKLPQLAKGLPKVRVISMLGVVPKDLERFHEETGRLVNAMTGGSADGQTSITVFDALGVVKTDHIERYLANGQRCPPELVREVAAEIFRRTDGVFENVIALIEQIEPIHAWRTFAEPRPAPDPTPEFDDDEEL
jgi:hypothetical protein